LNFNEPWFLLKVLPPHVALAAAEREEEGLLGAYPGDLHGVAREEGREIVTFCRGAVSHYI
jgi:hypothetical protein